MVRDATTMLGNLSYTVLPELPQPVLWKTGVKPEGPKIGNDEKEKGG